MNWLVDSALKSIHGPLILVNPNSQSLLFWNHYNISVNVSLTNTSFSTFSCFEHQFFSWGRVLYLRRIMSVSVWCQQLLMASLFVVGSLHTCKSTLYLGFHPLKVLYSHHENFFVKQSTINAWVHMGWFLSCFCHKDDPAAAEIAEWSVNVSVSVSATKHAHQSTECLDLEKCYTALSHLSNCWSCWVSNCESDTRRTRADIQPT